MKPADDETVALLRGARVEPASEEDPFAALASRVRDRVRARMTERRFASGETLIRQGDPGTFLLEVAEGTADVIVEDRGARHVLKRVGPGEILGEMALLTREPRTAHVVARSAVRARVLEAEDFHRLALRHPELAQVLTRLVARRLGLRRHDALTGKTLHGYRIRRRLGRGGMAVVYEAEELAARRTVALKMMSHGLVYDPGSRRRFEREADVVASFRHPNIARLHGRFDAFHTCFIVMEFCDGIPLDRIIARRHGLPEPAARRILARLASAVAYAHAAGVVHRDLKPGNVMVSRGGNVKLMDFGCAQPVGARLSRRELLLGTPRYMAPEQLAGRRAGRKADLFALGHILYEMLCGKPLFDDDDGERLRRAILDCRVPDLRSSCPGASEEILGVLEGLLAREPEARGLDLERVSGWS